MGLVVAEEGVGGMGPRDSELKLRTHLIRGWGSLGQKPPFITTTLGNAEDSRVGGGAPLCAVTMAIIPRAKENK